MGYFTSIVLLFISFFLKRKRGTWISPDVLFCFEWAIISLFASLHLFGMDEAKTWTWFIIFIGSISYVAGVLIVMPQNVRPLVTIKEDSFFLNKKTFWLLFFVVFYFSFKEFLVTLAYQAMGYTLQEVRNAQFGGDTIAGFQRETGALYEVFNALITAAKLIVVAVGIHYYTALNRRNMLYIAAVAGLVVMESFTDGGRWGLAFLLIEVLACYYFFKKYGNKSGKKKSNSFSILLITAFIIGVITETSIARGWEAEDFLPKYYRYLCGDVVFFDKHLDLVKESTPVYIIWNSLYGFWAMFLPFLRFLFGIPYPDSFVQAGKDFAATLQEPMQIGDNMVTNAFITPFYHLYGDGRLIGVIVGMLLLGVFAGSIYKKTVMKPNGRNIAMYLIVCQMILATVYFYPFAGSNYVFVFLFFLFYKKNSFNIFPMKRKGVM